MAATVQTQQISHFGFRITRKQNLKARPGVKIASIDSSIGAEQITCAKRNQCMNTRSTPTTFFDTPSAAKARIAEYDWGQLYTELDGFGCAVFGKLLSAQECRQLVGLYGLEDHFRSHIHMARHGFGKGEYRYFKYPLPDLLGNLRTELYPRFASIANEWNERMRIERRYPDEHGAFLKQCHDAGQARPTPLLLQYVPGDFNCLHQDLYGDLAFPIQVAILLSEPGQDFTGGEFVLTEQRPRMQRRAVVVPPRRGDAVAFGVHNRPVQGSKGSYRVNLRHGVSRIRSGTRHTAGIIFHDAK